ncbi:IclR family transcriptional regulator [Streptosporangium sp. NPDC001681]|uniref:IclR family transcriptional regulator n=1 Tax=Streptosporangium sp. NPDC001681 TaxID=3154395 RepID=UPI003326D220
MQQNDPPYRVEAVDRALTLLTLLAERGRLSVTEAGRKLGVAPSTAHRLLSTLCHREFAIQGDRRMYLPGPALLRLRTGDVPALPDRMRPFLQTLFDAVGETVHLMVRIGSEVLFVDGIESTRSLRVGLRVEARMPAYRTSGGKAMLADLEPGEVDALHADGLAPAADEKVPDLAALRRELEAVRRDHFGCNYDESEPGVTAIGASVGVIDGNHAALVVALPTARVASGGLETVAAELLRICDRVRHEVGRAGAERREQSSPWHAGGAR